MSGLPSFSRNRYLSPLVSAVALILSPVGAMFEFVKNLRAERVASTDSLKASIAETTEIAEATVRQSIRDTRRIDAVKRAAVAACERVRGDVNVEIPHLP